MPVPKSSVETSPRKLLRDVVLEKMLAAIQDGTLQAGERLNDDELVQWLGVSRTPIREAIAKLVDYGLVEMEANRYTRVATPDPKQFDEVLEVYYGIGELAVRLAVPKLDDAGRKRALEIIGTLGAQIAAEDHAAFRTLDSLLLFMVDKTENELLRKVSESLITRTQFVMLAAPEQMYWDAGAGLETFAATVRNGDGEAAAAVLRGMGGALAAHMAELRAKA